MVTNFLRQSLMSVHVLLLICGVACRSTSAASTYHIGYATHNSNHSMEQIMSLSRFADFCRNHRNLLDSNISVIFLPGNHILTSIFSLSQINSLDIYSTRSSNATIKCAESSHFHLDSVMFALETWSSLVVEAIELNIFIISYFSTQCLLEKKAQQQL